MLHLQKIRKMKFKYGGGVGVDCDAGGDFPLGVSDDIVVRKILRADFLQRYLLVRLDSR